MKKLEILFGVLRIPMDALAVFASLLLAYRLREASVDLIPGVQLLEPPTTLPALTEYLHSFAGPGIGLFIAIALVLRLYAFRVTSSAFHEVGRTLVAAAFWIVCVMAWYFLIRRQLFYSRILLVHSALFIALFVILGRSALTLLYRSFLLLGYGVRLVASVGRHPLALHAERTLQSDARYAYLGHAMTIGELMSLQNAQPLDLVLHTDPSPKSEETEGFIEYCRSQHIGYAFLPPVFADSPHQLSVEHLGLLPIVSFHPTPLDGWGRVLKRAFDAVIALALLLALLPALLLIALTVLLNTGWPIFYRSTRVGEQGRRLIPVWKFRSMVRDADAQKEKLLSLNERRDGPLFKMKADPRITRIGRVLRRWSLDELPQLWNVVLGHMSLVGPRPHLPDEVGKYTSFQRRVFAVRPGLTGLAQVSGRSDLTFEEEVRLDLQYIEEWSLLLDIWILWRTASVILNRKGAD